MEADGAALSDDLSGLGERLIRGREARFLTKCQDEAAMR
jgi:hypothetical protein